MNEYTFEIELYGLTIQVIGEFSPAEPETMTDPGWAASFEIEEMTHLGACLEIDSLPEGVLTDIEQAAFDSATADAQES